MNSIKWYDHFNMVEYGCCIGVWDNIPNIAMLRRLQFFTIPKKWKKSSNDSNLAL